MDIAREVKCFESLDKSSTGHSMPIRWLCRLCSVVILLQTAEWALEDDGDVRLSAALADWAAQRVAVSLSRPRLPIAVHDGKSVYCEFLCECLRANYLG